MRAVVAKYATDQGLMITLDSLTHVIPYYLRPEFGVARTEASFARSGVIQRAYRRASTRDERRKVRASAESMSNEILKAEEFTPPAECVVREREKPDYDYLQAHIVILPPGLESISFEELCDEALQARASKKRASRNSKKGSASKVRRSVTGRFSR